VAKKKKAAKKPAKKMKAARKAVAKPKKRVAKKPARKAAMAAKKAKAAMPKEPTGKPDNMPWISTYIAVRDVKETLGFYERAFGFTTRFAMTMPDGSVVHGESGYRDGVIMMGPESSPMSTSKSPATSGVESPVNLYIYCPDVDTAFVRARDAGATVVQGLVDQFYGDRTCVLKDPNGHVFHFATQKFVFDPSTMAPPAPPAGM